MKPVRFKESTKVLSAPESMPECGELHVFNDGKDCISKWKPSFVERIKILFGGCVWLGIMSGDTQPPVFVSGHYPFIRPSLWESSKVTISAMLYGAGTGINIEPVETGESNNGNDGESN